MLQGATHDDWSLHCPSHRSGGDWSTERQRQLCDQQPAESLRTQASLELLGLLWFQSPLTVIAALGMVVVQEQGGLNVDSDCGLWGLD